MPNNFDQKNYYEILGVVQTASKEEIKKAYKNIALIYHPDSNFFNEIIGKTNQDAKTLEDFQIITNAFNVLTSDEKRKEYDSTLFKFKGWEDEETTDQYFQDMLDKKGREYGLKNLARDRANTTVRPVSFSDLDKSKSPKMNESKREYINSIENSTFGKINKIRFSNKLDLLTILVVGLTIATIILYFLAR